MKIFDISKAVLFMEAYDIFLYEFRNFPEAEDLQSVFPFIEREYTRCEKNSLNIERNDFLRNISRDYKRNVIKYIILAK